MSRWIFRLSLLAVASLCSAQTVQSGGPGLVTTFRVRYVASGAVYLEGGRNAGLAEGTRLVIKGQPAVSANRTAPAKTDEIIAADGTVAQLKVVSVAESSAVCEVISATRTLLVGDVASLPQDEVEKMVEKRALGNTRAYPVVVSFTEGDPLDEDVREYVPKPPLPEVNRARGRIGFDYSGTSSGGGSHFSQVGLVLRADITRINGTYWNLTGYWRGSIQSRSSQAQPTLQDLLNRTYQIGLTYANPKSRWVAGIGRMYLPWASSLETIDGGYFGRRVGKIATAGIFAGSTPDPTSWSYNPDRRTAGTFVNFDGGDYDKVKYSSTFGFGVIALGWRIDRPFVFAENTVSFKRNFSFYQALQIDSPRVDPSLPAVKAGLSRSYTSFRVQANKRVTFDLNHSYFRDVPTFDPQLVGTGLLDKVLFQGFSAGVRLEGPRRLSFYTNVGRSSTNRDAKGSWNTMFGVTVGQIWRTGLRADVRYSKFNSAFAQGSYRSVSFSRNFGDNFRWELQGGKQNFVSPLTRDNGSHFVNSNVDVSFAKHYFLQGGLTAQRGGLQSYNQMYTTFGLRFNNRGHKREAPSADHK